MDRACIICAAAYADGIGFDFTRGDEVYGSCTQLREFFETRGQAYVLRVPSNFTLTLAAGTKLTCAQAVTALLKDTRRWEIRSAGNGSKGERWYVWAWIATASPRHHPLPAPMACHPLGRLDPPPQDPLTMVPQTRQTHPRRRAFPGQLAKCGCRSRHSA